MLVYGWTNIYRKITQDPSNDGSWVLFSSDYQYGIEMYSAILILGCPCIDELSNNLASPARHTKIKIKMMIMIKPINTDVVRFILL